MMNNYPIGEALNAAEGTIEIDLVNKQSGATYTHAPVLATNTMEQVLKEYAADIGINPKKNKILFANKRTGRETSDRGATVEEMELEPGDVLSIADDGCVA